MHRLISVFALACLVITGAIPATGEIDPASVAPVAAFQTGPTLEATVGLGGFVSTGDPATVSATIASPILVAGRLRVRGGGVSVSRPVEVPAGGEQVYLLTVPPLEDGTRLTVEVLDDGGDVIVSETVNLRSSRDEMAVGVVGSDQLIGTLGRVRTIVTDRPVAPLPVPSSVDASVFDAVDYLVVDAGGGDRLDAAAQWATAGGQLVVAADLAPMMEVSGTPVPTGVAGVTSVAIGAGRLTLVENLGGRSGEEWAAILRPTSLDLTSTPEFGGMEGGGGLLQVATESGTRQVPSLPWLLFAILGFALLIGPVNFVILSKLGKRDWAWVTIPAVALLAVAGFWIAGRQRIAGTNLSHASVVVSDGSLQARSAVVVAAGVAGERRVSFDPQALVYPERNFFGGSSAELAFDSDSTVVVDLDQLGFTGVGVVSDAPELEIPAVTSTGESVSIENLTDMSFWGWGVVRGASSSIGSGELEPGETADLANPPGGVNANFGFGFIDALFNERQLWEDPERAGLWSFSSVLNSSTDGTETYFVGLTDDFQPEVAIDGSPSQVPGMALVIVRVEGATDQPGQVAGVAGAEVVGVGFINWLDWGVQRVVSTDELTVGFTLPDPEVSPRFRDSQQFGIPAQRYEAWNWAAGEFVEIGRGDQLGAELKSPDGKVYVRLIGDEFGDNPFSPDSLALEWDA